ncbi:choice-of-anchor Q domain-containing protein [Paenibacillus urinalis]
MYNWMKILMIGGIAAAALLIFVNRIEAPSTNAASEAYYVALTGKDSNDGSKQSPWKTLQHAADTVQPGSTVYVRGGVYKQKLNITRSGSTDSGSITFVSYPNETAILDGTGLKVNGQEGLIEIDDASYITIQSLVVRNFTTSEKDQMPIGLFVHGSGSNIKLLNNKVYAIKHTAAVASDLSGRDAHGIAVYGNEAPDAITKVTIDGNELYDLVLGSSEALAINGNVDTFMVTNNSVHDSDNIGIDVIGFEGVSPDERYDQARNGIISGNKVYNITANYNPSYGQTLPNKSNSAGGIYVDGGKDSIIERNYSFGNDIGIELASEHYGKATSGITVRSNVVYNNRYTGIAVGGYDEDRGSTTDSTIINNTFFNNNTLNDGSGQLLLQNYTHDNVIMNNIFHAGQLDVFISNEYTSNSGNVVDYNLYYSPVGTDDSLWTWKDKEYAGLESYRKATNNDKHSIFTDPQFVNMQLENLHLQKSSPAIDVGMTHMSIENTLDIDGNNRIQGDMVNIGADE